MNWDQASMYSQTQFVRKCFSLFLFLHVFNTPFCTLSYFTYFYFLVLYLYVCKISSSLLSLIMTEVRSKRRAFFPIIFTSICFKKPLLIKFWNPKKKEELFFDRSSILKFQHVNAVYYCMENTSLKIWRPQPPVLHLNSVAYKRIAFLN